MSNLPVSQVRKLLNNLHDAELDEFCQENYYDIYNNFTRGMRKDEKITTLIDYCIRRNDFDKLLSLAKEFNPTEDGLGQEHSKENINIIKLQLQSTDQGMMRVRAINVPRGGTPLHDAELPYSREQLKAVLKALDIGVYVPVRFKPEYSQSLRDLGLLIGEHLHTDLYKIVGQRLFDVLFRGEILADLRIAQQNSIVICQLIFDPEEVILSQLPWELVHDGNTFLAPIKSGLEIVRCINLPIPSTNLAFRSPLKVLYIAPRPINDNYLPDNYEKSSIESGLQTMLHNALAEVKMIYPRTWFELEKELKSGNYDIMHFDGHGSYAKICPICQLSHYPSEVRCLQCGESLDKETAFGYLHFENNKKLLDKIKVEDLKVLLSNSKIQLVILTSCDSAISKDENVFYGVAPGLLQAGIPAIIAMQGSPTIQSMNIFIERVYSELAGRRRISEAVNSGRLSAYHIKPTMWFMPTVFLRTSNYTAKAFSSKL